jgi:signal transduction histidine kinase
MIPQPATVLIVDDNPLGRDALLSVLEAGDYGLHVAGTGPEALAMSAALQPDLILLDVMMPGMDGFEVCRRLRADAVLAETPILLVTALDDRGSRLRGFEAGADDFISKPFDRTEMRARVKTLCRLSLQRKAREAEQRQMLEASRLHEAELAAHARLLSDANRELEAASYTIAHDLRSPLRVIQSFMQVLETRHASGLDRDAREVVGTVRSYATRMSELLDGLLGFSRLGHVALGNTRVAMRQMAVSVAGEAGRGRNVAIRIGTLPDVHGDEVLLRQVWVNLVENAVKFSAKVAQPTLAIDARHTIDEIVFSVQDNGAGFDAALTDRLFGIFQRLHPATEFEGTGVGLATVRRIVERHGGRVHAETLPEGGARFEFALPAVRLADAPPTPAETPT